MPRAPAEVLPGEYSNEECPQFEFTGEYLKLEQRPPSASEGGPAPRCMAVGCGPAGTEPADPWHCTQPGSTPSLEMLVC